MGLLWIHRFFIRIVVHLVENLSLVTAIMAIKLLAMMPSVTQRSPKVLGPIKKSPPAAEVMNVPVQRSDDVSQLRKKLFCLVRETSRSWLRNIRRRLVKLLVWLGVVFGGRRVVGFWLMVGRWFMIWRLFVIRDRRRFMVWWFFVVGRWLMIWVWFVVDIWLIRIRLMVWLWNIIRIWVMVWLRIMVGFGVVVDLFIVVRIWIINRLWMVVRLRIMVSQRIWMVVRVWFMKSRRSLMVERFLVLLVVWFFNDVFRLWVMITNMIIFSGPVIVAM